MVVEELILQVLMGDFFIYDQLVLFGVSWHVV